MFKVSAILCIIVDVASCPCLLLMLPFTESIFLCPSWEKLPMVLFKSFCSLCSMNIFPKHQSIDHISSYLQFNGELYLLATDQGYINQPDLVWEKLNEVNFVCFYPFWYEWLSSTVFPYPGHQSSFCAEPELLKHVLLLFGKMLKHRTRVFLKVF